MNTRKKQKLLSLLKQYKFKKLIKEAKLTDDELFDNFLKISINNPYGIDANVVQYVEDKRYDGLHDRIDLYYQSNYSRDIGYKKIRKIGIRGKKITKSIDKPLRYKYILTVFR